MSNTFKWSNTFFVCSIIAIFCILLGTVPMGTGQPSLAHLVEKDEKDEKDSIPKKSPSLLAQLNKDSFYNYLEALEDELHVTDPEYRTVEFWISSNGAAAPSSNQIE